MLIEGMFGIIEINVKPIVEDGFGFLKLNAMLGQIGRGLSFIPFEFHK